MDDVVTFADRSDMPALLQAAIAHAQFESIHPFTDGNDRIDRALINTILRHRAQPFASWRSTPIASAESRIATQRLHEIPSQRRELTEPARRSSAAATIAALLPSTPTLSPDEAVALATLGR
jgi:Fic family protein